jgi:diguanylate cyclase (GGDEF)-like protein
VNSRNPALRIVISYIGVQFLLIFLLPNQFSWCNTLWIIFPELAASYACFRAAKRVPNEARMLWRLLAGSVLLAPIAAGLFMQSQFPGAVHPFLASEFIIFLNTLFAAVLLLIVSMEFDPRALRPFREMSAFLAVAIGALWFVLVFSVISIHGRNPPANLLLTTHMFNAISLFLALVATIRLLGTDKQEERSFFFVAAVFLWANTIFPAIRNQLLMRYNVGWPDLLIPAPYLLLTVLPGRGLPRLMQFWQPSFRVSSIVRSGGTAFLSFGLLLLGTTVSRMHFWIGASAALLSVVCYSVLNLITLSRGIEAEEALLAAKQKLEELAGLDGLTGIANRRTLDQRLEFEFQAARRSGQPISLLMIDVDHFKSLNDSMGHLVGDSYLVRVAQTLRDALSRTNDFVARYGGEEFVVLLPTTADAGAVRIAGRLHTAISNLRLVHPSSPSGRLTISIGCTTADVFTHHSPIALVRAADRALYMAKTHGRNRTEFLPFESGAIDIETAS